MSIIQSIRDKAAWIIIAAIALALIAFIVQDAFQNRNMFSGDTTSLGEVNGTKIDAIQFEERYKRAEEIYRQRGFPMNDMMRGNIRDGLWNEYVEDAIMADKYNGLGIAVQDKELSDILYGNNPPEDLRKQFSDPNTGMYDANAAYQQIQALRKQKNTPQYASFFEQYLPALAKNRQKEKYISLLANTYYVPKWLIEKNNADNSQKASISYINIPFSTISDSAVKVTEAVIKEYIGKNKDQYKQEKSRSVEYVMFDAGPTKEDTASTFAQAEAIRNEFVNTTDVQAFLVRNGSESQYNSSFQLKSKINTQHPDSIFSLADGQVSGPYLEGGNFMMVKMIAKKSLPDSVKVRHILIKTAEQGKPTLADSVAKSRIDSIVAAIRGGASFNDMVIKFSDDQGSKEKGGEYEFSSSQFSGISKEFAETIFYGATGDKKTVKVENAAYSGYHYIEVLSQKNFEQAYNFAEFSKAVIPSDETVRRVNGIASQFSAESRNKKQFDENVKKSNYNKLVASELKPLDAMIPGLGSSRELVKWAYEAKTGDVAESPFQVEDKFVVPVLTSIFEEGTMSPEKARPMVESILRNQEKAKQIAAKIGTVSTLDAAAKATSQQISTADSILFGSPFIPNVGQEPKVIGAAFNKAFQSKPSGPITGNGGVFVLQVNNISAQSTAPEDLAQQQTQQQDGVERMMADPRVITEILKKGVKITDNRYKFF